MFVARPIGEMVNTLPSQGNIHGFESHIGHHMLFKVPLTRKEAYDIIHKPTKKSSKELRKYVLEVFINGCKALLETPNTELI